MLTSVSELEFKKIKKFVYEIAGIYLKESKKPLVSNRLRKRLYALGFDSYMKYYNFITKTEEGKKELQNFIDALTTNETYFFRNPKHFEFLEKVFLPEIVNARENKSRNIRIWSAACATGEEPYSIAMLFREKIKDYCSWNLQISASDINRNVVEDAGRGVYKLRAVEKMPKYYLSRYFLKDKDDFYRLNSNIIKMVKFCNHNLLDEFKYSNFDCVFCRNVMIYFDDKSKNAVYENLSKVLRPGGFLVIGHAESLIKCDLPFKYVRPSIYQKI